MLVWGNNYFEKLIFWVSSNLGKNKQIEFNIGNIEFEKKMLNQNKFNWI